MDAETRAEWLAERAAILQYDGGWPADQADWGAAVLWERTFGGCDE